MAQSILYYPSIDIQDSIWLRNAILYWENVCSIVPFERYSDFSPEIQYLQEKGIYRAVYPLEIFASTDYINEFADILKSRVESHFHPVYSRYNDRKHDSNRTSVRIHRNKKFSPDLYELIHYRKLPSDLVDYFNDSGYIHDTNGNDWLEIDSRVASIYMRTLAEFTAKYSHHDMVIGSDKPSKIREIYQHTTPRSDNLCFSFIMERCLPQPSMETGFEEFLKFKETRKYELLEFRQKLRSFENDISRCQTPQEIKFEIESFKEKWELELEQIDKLFKDHSISYILGNAKTLIELTGGTAGILAGIQQYAGNIPPWLFGAGIGFSALIGIGINHINYRNKINLQRSNSGFAYITGAYKKGIIRKSPFFEIID